MKERLDTNKSFLDKSYEFILNIVNLNKKNLQKNFLDNNEFIWDREPMYQWDIIKWFRLKGWVDILSTRRVLYRWDKKVYIVQQRKWKQLYAAIYGNWKKITTIYFAKNYKIDWNKLKYMQNENFWEFEEVDITDY